MKSLLAYVLVALVLLQTFSRELLVVDYALNQATITARFCVNKARPMMHCNGKCYLVQKMRQRERENQAPSPLKVKLELLPAQFVAVRLSPPQVFAAKNHRFAWLVPGAYAAPLGRVFHPPLG
ncbi:hypothetical protein [Hymenobacter arizonensis]|uniref:Uncharacterized protein n=1 Tax=Hymenobacter arizonensis TaxID=1227077 RepID=A0A1I6B5X6_HYMAR|nr:hypothetical protein [Hymenobacter arizonensis]SFQ76325.1 hypothetical protein SAMN04515668_4199 [Hymenobacter arizonensis]